MPAYICQTCGVQHAPSDGPPERCIICDDERQYIGWGGQQWTTLDDMKTTGYRNILSELEPGLTAIVTRPRFAIAQRALLVQTAHGNFLWDCISYIDDDTVRQVRELGGVQGISVSHPHFYGSIIEWSHAFDGAPVYIPTADKEWVVRPDDAVQYYEGTLEIWPGPSTALRTGLTLVQCGGHFEGSAVLHWESGADGQGALLTGDTISVAQDRRYVTFMRSYPNYIPLPQAAVRAIVSAVEPYSFERIYGGWTEVTEGAKEAVRASAERYIRWITG